MFGLRLDLLGKVLREVEAQFENGQDERHPDDEAHLSVDGAGWLQGLGVHHDKSPKWSRSTQLETSGPLLVVSHGTATARRDSQGRPISVALLDAIRKSDGREASWHVLVDDFGGIWQSIPFTRAAWHAGSRSAAQVVVGKRLLNVNACSVGIEYVNAGECRLVGKAWSLRKQAWLDVPLAWRGWPYEGREPSTDAPEGRGPGPVVPEGELTVIGRRHWHAYTPEQFASRRRIIDALVERWPALAREVTLQHPDGRRVVVGGTTCGHAEVDPKRKADPYPSFLLVKEL